MPRTTQSACLPYVDDGRTRYRLAVTRVEFPADQSMPAPAASSTPQKVSEHIWAAFQEVRFGEAEIVSHATPRDYDKLMEFSFVREMLEKTGSIQIEAGLRMDAPEDENAALSHLEAMLTATKMVKSGRKSSNPYYSATPVELSAVHESEAGPASKKARTDAGPAPPAIFPAIPVTVLMRPPDEYEGEPYYEGWD